MAFGGKPAPLLEAKGVEHHRGPANCLPLPRYRHLAQDPGPSTGQQDATGLADVVLVTSSKVKKGRARREIPRPGARPIQRHRRPVPSSPKGGHPKCIMGR